MTSSASTCVGRGRPSRLVRSLSSPLVFPCLLAGAGSAFAQGSTPPSLEPVVVTANRTPQPLSTVLGDLSVLDHAAIERSGVTGVADLLARLPGIEVARNGGPGTATSVFVRGSETRHTAVYLDGVRLDSQSTGGALWEQIPLDQVERIEVLRGPAAAVYGSDAVAGVVQIFTRRGQGALRPTAALTMGSFHTKQAQVGVSGAAEGFDYAVGASHGSSRGFNARTLPSANPDDDGWRRSTAQARLGWQFHEAHRVEASLISSTLRSQYDSSPSADDVAHHTLRTGSLSWQGHWSEDASTRLQAGQTESTYETQPSYYRTETTLRNYTLLHEQRVGSNLVTATVERREDKLVNPATAFAATLEGTRHQDAIGLGWRADFDGGHGLQAQVRRDDDSEFGGKSTGSLAWGWSFMPPWRITAAAASSFRVPTLYQRFSQYGNASLVPESGRNVELGLRFAEGPHEASLVGWRNEVRNLISFGPPGPCVDSFGCYTNTGRARLQGATLSGRTLLGAVSLHGSVDWHDPKNLDTGLVLARRAKRLATFGVETTLAGWTFGADVQAAGERFENAANTQRLPGYAVVNVFASKAVADGLVLEGRVDNAGDKAYELARTYATAGRSGQVTLRWTLP